MQVNSKVFEVDQIVCGRENKGCQEYLVYWKGFDLSAATWEPVENLISCSDLINQFQRRVSPIPGANPFTLSRTEKTKTVHVKMLLTRKNKLKRPRSKSAGGLNGFLDMCDTNLINDMNSTENTPNKKKGRVCKSVKKKKFSESEVLIRDTLVHESKTMVPEKDSLDKLYGIYSESVKYVPVNSPHMKKSLNRSFKGNETPEEELLLSTIRKGYMKIVLNNTKAHNVITIAMLESLRDCFLRASKNMEVKAVLLCNKGDYFCSGIDYSHLMNCLDDKEYKSLVTELMCSIRSFLDVYISFPKPVVCAVNGPTLEFGLALVVNSDFAYASSKASFDVMYNKIHLTPIGCITHLLPSIVGNSMANSMLYMGGRYSAVSACDRGLVLDMYGVNSFEEDMEKKMLQLSSNSGPVLESTKRLVKHFDKSRLDVIYNEELHEYQQALLTKEVRRKIQEDWTMVVNLYSDI